MIVFVLLASWRLGEYSADRENQIRQVQRVIVAVPVWSSWQWIKEWYEDSWGGNVLCIVEYEYLGMKWLWRTLWTDLCHDGCACMAGQSKLIKKKDYLWVLREIAREYPGSPSGVVACLMCSFSFLSSFFSYLSLSRSTDKSPFVSLLI